MTKRVAELRKLLFAGSHKQYRVENLQISILDEETEKLSFAVRKALAFKKMCELAPVFIQTGELIVGGKTVYALPAYITKAEMDYGTGYLEIDKNYNYLFGFIYNLCQDERGYGTANSDAPCYDRLLPLGFPGLMKEIQEKKEKETDKDKIDFYNSTLISLEGVLILIKRYEELVRKEWEKEKSEERRAELKNLGIVLKNIQEAPPSNFWEAVQFIYFIQFLLWMEGGYLIPLGRMDQYLYPFYEEDLRTEKFSHEDMYELLECMFIKLNYEIDRTHGGDEGRFNSDTGQTVTIGGIKPDTGEDASNELTISLMDIKIDLHITDPRIHLRIHKNTPENVWKKAAELTGAGMGYPTYDNGEGIIEALESEHGYREEDARDYCASGCWEIIIPGKSSNTNLGDIDCLRVLEWALNDGKNVLPIDPNAIGLVEGRWGLRTGKEESFLNFGQLMTAFKAQMKHNIVRVACNCNAGRMSPSPLYSACMEDCIEKGKDIADGGCRYYETDFQLSSLSNAADSLYAIKKLVYEDKRYTLTELNTILKNNYEGNEALRQEIINKFPKFGNNDERVDSIAEEIVQYFVQEVTKHTNAYGGPYRARIASALGYVSIARQLAASADGRRHGDFYSADLSPGLGAERSGPTGVIKSCGKIPSEGLAGGEIVDMRFSPSALKSEESRSKFIALIKCYFALGGLQIQVDVQDKNVLIDAKKHPENYPDLLVRVWGFSAYFVSLPEDCQDQLIGRAEMEF